MIGMSFFILLYFVMLCYVILLHLLPFCEINENLKNFSWQCHFELEFSYLFILLLCELSFSLDRMLFFIRFLFYFMPLWETVWLLKLQWVSPQPHKINPNESRPFHVNLFFSPQPAMFTATHLVISMFSVFFVLCWMLEAKHIGCVGFIKCSRACKPSWAVSH